MVDDAVDRSEAVGFPSSDAQILSRGLSSAGAASGEPLTRGQPLFWHFFGALGAPKVAMRIGDWKLLGLLDKPGPAHRNHIDDDDQHAMKTAEIVSFELYNLREDISEAHDLSASEPERLKAMSAQMRKLYHEVRDECPIWPAWTFANYDGPRIGWPSYWKPGQKDHD